MRLKTFLPVSYDGLTQIASAWDTPQQNQVLSEVYPKLPKISVDYAVMEPASHGKGEGQVVVVEMPVQWLDVGSWPALAETLQTDEHDNAVDASNYVFIDCDGNIVVSHDPDHLLTDDRRERHDHRPHQGCDDGLPETRCATGEGVGVAGEGAVRRQIPVMPLRGNSKSQAPNHKQISNSNEEDSKPRGLRFGIFCIGICL